MASKVRRQVKAAERVPDLALAVPPGLGVALGAVIAALHDTLTFDAITIDLGGEIVPVLDGVERIAPSGDLGAMAREKGTAVVVQNAPGTGLPNGYSTALALPIESKIASYGSLILYHREPHRYTAAETELAALLLRQTVEGIWRQAVARMRQDELAQQIEQRAVEVAAFDDIMPRISFRDPTETLQSVVDTAADLAGADFTSI
ncbi:MAG TPA: hypothetical protein VFA78_03355, partial [Chloroflexota bacterium]|nr:hypothetical protein [Chloroflexota bacterium]